MNYLVFIQFIIFAIAFWLLLAITKSGFQAGVVYFGAWLFALSFQIFNFVEYEYPPISVELLGIQTLFAFAFAIGSLVPIPMFGWQLRANAQADNPKVLLLFDLIQCITVLALGCIVGYQLLSGGASLLNIEATRASHWEEGESSSPLSSLKALFRPVVMAMMFTLPFQRHWFGRFFGISSVLIVGFGEALLAGGRAFLALTAMGLVFVMLFKRQQDSAPANPLERRPSKWASMSFTRKIGTLLGGAFSTFVALYLTFGLFPSIRNSRLVGNEDTYLRFETGKSVVAPFYRTLGEQLDADSIAVFAYGTHYLTSPMMRTNFLLLETDATRWYLLGKNNFPLFSKVMYRVGGGRTTEQVVKERIAIAQPYGRNPWFGGVGDIFIDFGIYGGAVFMFFFGCFASWIRSSMTVLRQPEYFGLYALSLITVLAFPYFSAIRLSMVFNPVLVLFAMLAIKFLAHGSRPIDDYEQ